MKRVLVRSTRGGWTADVELPFGWSTDALLARLAQRGLRAVVHQGQVWVDADAGAAPEGRLTIAT